MMKTKPELNSSDFRRWLQETHNMGEASARDVVSRTRRAAGFVNLVPKDKDTVVLGKLSENQEFMQLSTFVQCQLKRAVTLYRQFLASK